MRAILSTALLAFVLAGCAVSPTPDLADEQSPESTSEDVQDINSCTSFCGFGDFYCPPNPLMECFFYCYQTCVVCDGETTCFDNPPPG
jgi:hypothetical protein